MNIEDNEDKNILLKEDKYQKIKSELNRKDNYSNKEELDVLYQKAGD